MGAPSDKRVAALDTVALGQTGLVALLLVTQFAPQPEVSSGAAAQGGLPYGVPLASFIVMAISLAAGYCMLICGALRSPWRIGILVIALVTGLLAIQPGTTLAGGAQPLEEWLSIAQLLVLAAFWLWWLRAIGKPPDRVLAYTGVLLLTYYGLEFGSWLAFVQAGHKADGAGILLHSIAAEVLLLPLALTLPILAFSTDWVNRARRIVQHALFFRQGQRGKLYFTRALPAVTTVVAAGMLAYEVSIAHLGLLGGLAAVLIIAGIMTLLVRLAEIDTHWPLEVPPVWVFVAAAFFFVDLFLLVDLNPFPPGLPSLMVSTVATLLPAPIALAGLALALMLILKGRAGKVNLGTGGLLLAMVAMVVLTATYPDALAAAGVSAPRPSDIIGAIVITAASATLIWLAVLLAHGELGQHTTRLRYTLVLLSGLLCVRGGYALLQRISGLGPQYTILLAALFLLPPMWTYLLPAAQRRLAKPLKRRPLGKLVRVLDGEAEEKPADGAAAEASQLMQTGFVLISNCLFMYLGTFREPVPGAAFPSFLRNDLTASGGLLLLAPPVVVLSYILRVRHRPRRVKPPAVSPEGEQRAPAGGSHRRITVTAAALTAAVTAVLFAVAFPRTVHASEYQAYTAAVPGPNCDAGNAYWALTQPPPLSIECTQAGMRLTVPARKATVMTFIPPNGYFVSGYRVSVRVDFIRLASGCVTVETRVTATGYYLDNVCSTGTWAIFRYTGATGVILADGIVAPASNYAVAVTADGGNERMTVDGLQVASISDPRFTSTHNLAVGIDNLTGSPGVVAISQFAFVPLEQPATADASYSSTGLGPACAQGTGQWALMTSENSRMSCAAGGTSITTLGRGLDQLGFTPPDTTFPPDYQVSVRASLGGQPSICAVIGVRMVAENGYLDGVCGSGVWFIDVRTGSGARVVAHGAVPRRGSYLFQAAADGVGQSLVIDGVQVARVTDASPPPTAYVLVESLNSGTSAGTAVLSDFAYTPLP
jgi:hypothetical protein